MINPKTVELLRECPEIYRDEIGNMDFDGLRKWIADGIRYTLQNQVVRGGPWHGTVYSPDGWKDLTLQELSEHIAVYLMAGMAPKLEQAMYANFLAALKTIEERTGAGQAGRS